MYSEKLENLLTVSLEATQQERSASAELSAGVDEKNDRWEITAKFFALSEEEFAGKLKEKYSGTEVTVLLCNYCIIETARENINLIAGEPEIIYIEKPKILNYNLINDIRACCPLTVPLDEFSRREAAGGRAAESAGEADAGTGGMLSGSGVITAVIDTGINIADKAFRNSDRTTRILRLWNQQENRIYDSADINDELSKAENPEIFDAANSRLFGDYSNHGINVCKIACGNDGVAFGSSIVFVALRRSGLGYSNTTDMMRAIDFCIRTAISYNMPIAVNISYGSNYGAHTSEDIQTSYINDVCGIWKCSICVAAGNEARDAVHYETTLSQGGTAVAELSVQEYEQNISFAIWHSPLDEIKAVLRAPDGESIPLNENPQGLSNYSKILTYAGGAKPYSEVSEIYVSIGAQESGYVEDGIWSIIFTGKNIKIGTIDIWLSTATVINEKTGFLRPTPELTVTIPSTAQNVLTVGSYNAATGVVSAFSGRGYVREQKQLVKPDLVAPGENVVIDEKNVVTGTSFAVPFVTGAAALLMEWGIVRQNDAYLYGDKLKSALKAGAAALTGQQLPSASAGWGRLCISETLSQLMD